MALTSKLVDIADAIRNKTNTTNKMTLEEMPSKINEISSAENLTEELNTYNAELTEQKTSITEIIETLKNKSSGNFSLQDKTVEITENGITTITADNGYDGLNNVEVTTNVAGSTKIEKKLFTIDDFIQKGSTYDTDGITMNCTSNVSTGFNGVFLKEVTDGTYYITTTTTKGRKDTSGFWYVYKYVDPYFYVINLAETYFYKLNTSGYLNKINSEGSFTRSIDYDEVVKVVVEGSTQYLWIDDVLVATIRNANTIGASNEGSGSEGTSFIMFKDLYKEVEVPSSGKYAPRWIRFTSYTGTELDEEIANLDTSNLTHMNTMFQQCTNLTSLDLSGFNTSNVTNMQNMFYLSSKIASLNVSNFNTSKVTNMSQMFARCSSLTSLDLSSFETSKVTNMQAIFDGCSSLQKLDIRNFNFSNVSSYGNMFNNVPAGCEIIVKDDGARDWVLAKRSDLTNVKTVAELEV